MSDIPQVLFVCIHNAGRSQMAAALLDQEAAGRVRVTSAGSQPASELNPAVVQAMAEIGLDLSHACPKPLTTDKVQAADVVITMGCGDTCPFYPGKRYPDWDLPDPAGLDLAAVRPIRDEIRERVRALLAELEPPAHDSPSGPPRPGLPVVPIWAERGAHAAAGGTGIKDSSVWAIRNRTLESRFRAGLIRLERATGIEPA
jgi:arsenate reductase (thioredoxin)